MVTYIKKLQPITLTALIVVGGYTHAPHAAPLDLANVPLYLGSTAEANLFFIIDDSGSMDWEVVTRDFVNNQLFTTNQPDGTNHPGNPPIVPNNNIKDRTLTGNCTINSGTFTGYLYGVEFGSNTYGDNSVDCNTASDTAWRFRNLDYNPLYFNPNATYAPWLGVDSNGNPFGNISITNSLDNPFDPSGETIDLTDHNSNWLGGTSRQSDGIGFRYYVWNDDGDGIFENGEEVEHRIRDENAATQQNFANWFSYYRKREYVAKAAYGQLIAQARNVRMGMGTLHNHNNVKTAIQSMNADPASGNKRALLDNLYDMNSRSGTPLRRTVDNAGKYLECKSNSFFSTCPALAVADGGACQQNFMVMMTDGFYNSSFNFSGSNDNKDGDNNTLWDGGAYADGYNNTLADIAMHYYERDLQPGLPDELVPIPGVDEATHQHAVTYGVAFGVEGTITAMPPNNTDPFAWPNPFSGGALQNAHRIDDVRHASYNGRGLFLSAITPQDLITALNDAFADIGDRTGSSAAVATSTTTLTTDTKVYQARFDSGDWAGELQALPVNLDGTLGAALWDAGDVINNQDYDTGREIITYSTDPLVRDGVAFRWSDISAAQQAALHDDPATPAVDNDGDGSDRLDFLRGDNSNEGTKYRTRSSKLGDIAHSGPFFVGTPPFFYPDNLESQPYSSFVLANQTRTPVVYVGANDGMVHGFNADTGAEVLAYVPSPVYANLSKLTDPAYAHRYFVDGSLFVADAFVSGAWMSVLTGSMGAGGQGIYALNVTDPSMLTEGNADNVVLWEFTDADDPDLGYTYGEPRVVRMANGQWAAVFGNGYNNTDADGNASTTGHAVLYIAFIEGGMDGSWDTGDVIKLDTQAGSTTTPNGLASAAPVDFNNDEITDYIYAGDLEGNMWKFDVTNPNPAVWGVAYGGATPQPLFTAVDGSGNPQPITSRPDVGLHPNGVGFMVYVGTGKYIENGDNNATGEPTQTFYGIWDKNETTLLPFNRSHLRSQTIMQEIDAQFDTDGDGIPDTTESVRALSNNPINWHTTSGNPTGTPPSTHLGWYLDLVNCDVAADGVTCNNSDNFGERAVTNPLLRTGRVIFTTLLPSSDACAFGGDGWLMEIDIKTGGQLAFSPFDFNNDLLFTTADYVQVTYDVNGDGVVDANDQIPASGVKQAGIPSAPVAIAGQDPGDPELKLISLSTGTVKPVKNNPGPGEEGRQSWRQLFYGL